MTELICIVCPNGCHLQVEKNGDDIVVKNNKCKRGICFAIKETLNPVRSVTSTVATVFPALPVVPVRTNGEIPKSKIMELMKLINSIKLDRPYKMGEVVYKNALDTGVDIIVTTDMTKLLGGN